MKEWHFFVQKYIRLILSKEGWIFYSMKETDRQTKGNEDGHLCWPITSSLLDHIFKALRLLSTTIRTQPGTVCGPLGLTPVVDLYLPTTRLYCPLWDFLVARWDTAPEGPSSHLLALSGTNRINSGHKPRLTVSHIGICIYHFETPTHFRSTTWLLLVIYTGASCAEKSLIDGSVKGQ